MSYQDCLRCPATGKPLTLRENGLFETPDGREYPSLGGVPILIDSDRSLFSIDHFRERDSDVADTAKIESSRLWEYLRRLAQLGPTDSRNILGPRNLTHFAQLISAGHSDTDPARVLVVGGGVLGEGLRSVLAHPAIETVETDVFLGPRTQVVCDGHALPFADECFDGVICQWVLEHVLDPWRVASEITRVVRPGGLLYSEVPFMQQVHEGAFDFTRFTLAGHRRLFRDFDAIWAGAVSGPGMALAWSLRYFVITFAGRSRRARSILGRLVRIASFWLLWLDRWLINAPGAGDAASGTGLLGRKADDPIGDDELVAMYSGTCPTPGRWD